MTFSKSREDLYNEIWKEPISKVCKNYNISDNAIRKKCIAFNIPMPDNAYWTNLRFGKKVVKKLLPEFAGNNNIVFEVKEISNNPSDIVKNDEEFYYFEASERQIILKAYNDLHVKTHLEKTT